MGKDLGFQGSASTGIRLLTYDDYEWINCIVCDNLYSCLISSCRCDNNPCCQVAAKVWIQCTSLSLKDDSMDNGEKECIAVAFI